MLNIKKVRQIQKQQSGGQFLLTNPLDQYFSSNPYTLGPKGFSKTTIMPDIFNNNIKGNSKNPIAFNGNSLDMISRGLGMASALTGNKGLSALSSLGTIASNNWDAITNFKNLSGTAKVGGVAGIAGGVADVLGSYIPNNNSSTTQGINQAYDAISSSAMMFSPVGTVIGGAMKVGGLLSDGLNAAGLGTDQMTGTDKLLDSKFLKLTPIGLANSLGARKTDTFTADTNTLNQVGSSYAGTSDLIDKAVNKSGKKYGLLSSSAYKRAQRLIHKAQSQQNIMTNIANEAEDLEYLGNNSYNNMINYQNQLNGGFNPRYSLVAKKGAKLNSIINLDTKEVEWEPEIDLWVPVIEETPKFKEGGNIEEVWEPVIQEKEWEPIIDSYKKGGSIEQKNVIPEGNLHARLHHMDNDSNITKKGIPVIDNDGEQQAEIELNEIIFTLDVTQKLEKLYNKFYSNNISQAEKDKIAIEAGHLLVDEILFNTDDRTGLINTLKQGGIINGSR